MFKNKKRLSLLQDDFVCFEYIEQNPLVIQNIGMGSKMYKYLYNQTIMKRLRKKDTYEEEVLEFKKYIHAKYG